MYLNYKVWKISQIKRLILQATSLIEAIKCLLSDNLAILKQLWASLNRARFCEVSKNSEIRHWNRLQPKYLEKRHKPQFYNSISLMLQTTIIYFIEKNKEELKLFDKQISELDCFFLLLLIYKILFFHCLIF